MNTAIFMLSLRQLVGKRRMLLMMLFAALPVLAAIIFRLGDPDVDQQHWVANVLLNGLVVMTLMPLVTLVAGTTAIGMEIEDGTIVYLLAKPVQRFEVIVSKLAATWAPTALLLLLSTTASAAIALGGGSSLLVGFAIGIALGSLVYCCIFLALSVSTNHALIAGLIYVFLWEGVVTKLFTGTRVFSVRQYTLGVADLIANTSRSTFEADLGGVAALVLMTIVGVAAVAFAIRRLSRLQINAGV
jgi:ABC-2 type transport system permease protein